ncbi:uncharacterized protein LOC113673371 [Pocillopora damicornis]|uniref:uncharacterized protein LOC113673371 n=1 Tax=Pocillopora damicornis TaxID=46731 RepID=UPI000F54D994|nr:uncharacterized protein LOC113673371 [Pocillopora damicornis]
MKVALSLILCLAFAFVVNSLREEDLSFLEDDILRDETDSNKRFLFKKRCSTDADCSTGQCCFQKFGYTKCLARKGEGRICHPSSKCFWKCQEGLECQRSFGIGSFAVYKCAQPTEPGSSDIDM